MRELLVYQFDKFIRDFEKQSIFRKLFDIELLLNEQLRGTVF